MKKILVSSLIAISILTFTGCSSKEPEVKQVKKLESECIVSGEDAPSWVCGDYEESTKYVAVGSAPMSKLGHNFSRNEALMNARTNLVNQIELQIKNHAETYMRSAGLKENEMVEKVVTQVSKQSSSMTLKESKQISYWQSEKDNTIYILVAIDKANVSKDLQKDVEEAIDTEVQIRNSEDALNNIK